MKLKYCFVWFFICLTQAFASDYFVLIQLERFALAQQALKYVASLDETNLDIQIIEIRLYLKQKNWKKAQQILNQILLTTPHLDAYLLQIVLLQQQMKYHQALEWTKWALIFHPFEADLYLKQWQLEQAMKPDQPAKPKISVVKQASTIPELKAHLIAYPKDADAALLLAKIYLKKNEWKQAYTLLKPYIQMYPGYIDLYLLSIRAYIQVKAYHKAWDLCQQGLIWAPHHPDLLKKQADLQYLQSTPIKSTSSKAESVTVNPEKLNELGVFDQLYYISDKRQLWDYTSFIYGRQTNLGKVYGKINYANRLKREANQYELEFFPKLGRYVYLDLAASVANQPVLFPHYNYSGEAFVVLPKLFQFSIGDQFNRITDNLQFSRFTASITKEFLSGLSTTFRSYIYFPGSGQNSIFYSLNFRRMLLEPYIYLGMVVGTGTTPDLANLETVNFIVLKNKVMLSPYLNFSVLNDSLVLNFSFLYQNQVFPNQRQREWLGSTMGVTWRF